MNASELRPSDAVVYADGRFTLGQTEQTPYLIADGVRLTLSCHPYEPCLYITDEAGRLTVVHNAFDPCAVLELFCSGGTVTSITGRTYDPAAFCRMVAYAAGKGELSIDEAERVFGGGSRQETVKAAEAADDPTGAPFTALAGSEGEDCFIPENDPAFALLSGYPDLAVEYCLVQSRAPYRGYESHRAALACACRKLLQADEEEPWRCDLGQARGSRRQPDDFFIAVGRPGALTYRTAFLSPPYPHGYTAADFDRVNAALFPGGSAALEMVEWSTDWSDYFDDGHEWWGTLCMTVYDRSLSRFVVILASATD